MADEAKESSRSSGSTETFSLEQMATRPPFLMKKMGSPEEEPAPKILSPKGKHHH